MKKFAYLDLSHVELGLKVYLGNDSDQSNQTPYGLEVTQNVVTVVQGAPVTALLIVHTMTYYEPGEPIIKGYIADSSDDLSHLEATTQESRHI